MKHVSRSQNKQRNKLYKKINKKFVSHFTAL